MYFDMKLQTNSKTIRSVCFSAEKHSAFKKKYEASSPIKISNYSLKRNSTTNDVEIHINKRTKLDEPQDDEVNFDITQEMTPQILPTTDINEVLTSNKSQVSVVGRVVFHGPVETISTKGKLLTKQEASITDDTASIRVVLWENDISKISSDLSYKLYKVMVKNYQGNKYLTLNKQTIISQISQQFERENNVDIQHQFQTVHCPADGVNSVHRFISCKKCHTKVIPQGNIVKCSECGLAQLQQKCSSRYFATVQFGLDEKKDITLKLFEDKLIKLYELYKVQIDVSMPFDQFTDDQITEMLLTVNAKIIYNEKLNVIDVQRL